MKDRKYSTLNKLTDGVFQNYMPQTSQVYYINLIQVTNFQIYNLVYNMFNMFNLVI